MLLLLEGCSTVKSISDSSVKSNTVIQKESKERNNYIIQIVEPTLENITGTEQLWLGHQIQDKLKSNLQDYLGMEVVVDSKLEAELKQLQREAESEARDESSAIELGKITTAKYALFSKIRKSNIGYIISINYIDITTGEQKAFVTSKEYTKSEYLYGNTGAVDEITVSLGDKLGIQISDIYRRALTNGTADFTVEAQLELAEQNEAQYKRLMQQLNEQLNNLRYSTDISANEDIRKIEAEKALLVEKQKSEAKRKAELEEQKNNSALDTKKEEQRSIEFITKRDEIAQLAAEKASLIRQVQKDKQGVLEQINLLENKKKVLIEIRQNVENQCLDLYKQYINDKNEEIERIRNKPYLTVELENGEPTNASIQRRENQIIALIDSLYNKLILDSKSLKNATNVQEKSLLTEIRAEQKNLSKERTVSSLGDELKVSYGNYSGENNGWNAYISLYSGDILLYTDTFIITYESITGKKAPNIATELNDSIISEYTNTVEMYNSLFARGTPLLQFELDYNVIAEQDDKPSRYLFNANRIRIFSIADNKLIQTTNLKKNVSRVMKPEWDLREKDGIIEEETRYYKVLKKYFARGLDYQSALSEFEDYKRLYNQYNEDFIMIPGKNFVMQKTKVSQTLYKTVMNENPTKDYNSNGSVENVGWVTAIQFCNKLSEKFGYEPVYNNKLEMNPKADGFRLPTVSEWDYVDKLCSNSNSNLEIIGMHDYVTEWCYDAADFRLNGWTYRYYRGRDGISNDGKYAYPGSAAPYRSSFRLVRTVNEY